MNTLEWRMYLNENCYNSPARLSVVYYVPMYSLHTLTHVILSITSQQVFIILFYRRKKLREGKWFIQSHDVKKKSSQLLDLTAFSQEKKKHTSLL